MAEQKKRILVLGKNGQLATALKHFLPHAIYVGSDVADLTKPQKFLAVLHEQHPHIVINAAAYTQVDLAQKEVELCTQINGTSVGLVSQWCASHGAFLIHISTDYVFDGKKTSPYTESDETHPLNIYGTSKLLAEHLIQKNLPQSLILRTSWLYHESGNNFIKSMLKLAQDKPELRVVDDQISSPTYATDLAEALSHLVKKDSLPTGLYHLSHQGFCSRWEMITYLMEQAQTYDPRLKAKILRAKTPDFPTPAVRPMETRLDCSKATRQLGISLPTWQQGIDRFLNNFYCK